MNRATILAKMKTKQSQNIWI